MIINIYDPYIRSLVAFEPTQTPVPLMYIEPTVCVYIEPTVRVYIEPTVCVYIEPTVCVSVSI